MRVQSREVSAAYRRLLIPNLTLATQFDITRIPEASKKCLKQGIEGGQGQAHCSPVASHANVIREAGQDTYPIGAASLLMVRAVHHHAEDPFQSIKEGNINGKGHVRHKLG
jgi:hypothetical protein